MGLGISPVCTVYELQKNLQPGCKKFYGFILQDLLFQQGLVVDTVLINFIFHCLPGQLEYGRCF